MTSSTLTQHDRFVLEIIKDPEAGPSAPVRLDASLPRDPHITNPELYATVTLRERGIISIFQKAEFEMVHPTSQIPEILQRYQDGITQLEDLALEYPKYASAKNNIAQGLRRLYGDGVLIKKFGSKNEAALLNLELSPSEKIQLSSRILKHLDTAINLLSPLVSYPMISPQAAKTLSQAYTQRGAIYHYTAKQLSDQQTELLIDPKRREASWTTVQFEENASRDFMMGGRYGNEIAKGLAVAANPTAKLCGEMVKEAMRKEYAGETA